MSLEPESLPQNTDPRPGAGSGITPISEKGRDITAAGDISSIKGTSANESGANPISKFDLSQQSPPFPTLAPGSQDSNPLTYQDLKPMIFKAVVDMAQEGSLPSFITNSGAIPDFRFGVQLSQPANAAVEAPSIPPPAKNYSLDVEHQTSSIFQQAMGTSGIQSMSKMDTIQKMADEIYKEAGGSKSLQESKEEAAKKYEAKESEVEKSMSAPKIGGTSYNSEVATDAAKRLTSTQRLNGETGKQYEERRGRMDQINAIVDPTARKEAMGKFVSEQLGDMYLPIALRRADGQHQTLAYLLSGVNIQADEGVTDLNGNDKPYSSYYATIPPFLGFSADQNRNYTVWFGDSNDNQFQTESVYQVSINAPQDPTSQIVLDVGSKHIDGAPTIFINSSTAGDQAKLEPTKLTLANSNNNYITVDTDQNEVFIGNADSSDQVYLNSDKLYLSNSGYSGSYETDQVILSDGSHTLTLDIPDGNASWQTIQVCVDGQTKSMKVFGTEPV